MAMEEWTPGPWSADDDDFIYGGMPDEVQLACIIVGDDIAAAESRANTRLIVAAPDLYDACAFALSVLRANFPVERSEVLAIERLDAAMKKARGDEE